MQDAPNGDVSPDLGDALGDDVVEEKGVSVKSNTTAVTAQWSTSPVVADYEGSTSSAVRGSRRSWLLSLWRRMDERR